MRTSLSAFCLLLAMGAASGATGQEPLTLDRARAIARASNHDVAAMVVEIERAHAQVQRAWTAITPRVTAGAGVRLHDREIAIDMPDLPQLGLEVDDPVFQHDSLGYLRVGVQTQLLDPAFFMRLRGAREGEEASRAEVEAARGAVDLVVIELFHHITAVDALIEATRRREALLQEHLETVQVRRELRAATDLDVERADVELLDATMSREELMLSRRSMIRSLGVLLGGAEIASIEGVGNRVGGPLPDDPAGHAQTNRPELLALAHRETAARALWSAHRLSYLPSLVADAQLNWQSEDTIDGEQVGWQITLGLQWDLFAGGQRRAAITEARAARDLLAVRTEQISAQVDAEVTEIRDAMATADQRVAQSRRRLELTQRALASATTAFDEGAIAQIELFDAQDLVFGAETALVTDQLDLDLARWRLLSAAGALPEPR